MKRRIAGLVLVVSMLGGALCACSDSDKDSDETTAATEDTEAAEETEAADETEAPEETDEAEPSESDAAVSKIVSLSPTVTEIVFALGGGDKVVGVTSYDDYPEDVFTKTVVGDTMDPDVETIITLEPDIVFASVFLSEDAQNAISDAGLELVVVEDGANVEDMIAHVQMVADLIGMSEEGEELAMSLSDRVAEVVDSSVDADVSVYYVAGYGEYGDFTAGEGTFVDNLITLAGAVNAGAAADGWSISQEAILEADPDYLLIPEWATDITTMEPYASLTAVEEGRVIPVDVNLFDRQGPRNVDAIELIQGLVADYAEAEADAA